MDLYYLFADIRCLCSLVQNRKNLGASSGQIPDKFRTSFDKFGQVSFWNLSMNLKWIFIIYLWIFLCMYLGTKPDKFGCKLRTSPWQVLVKFRTSFVFKLLVRKLSENQTCPRVVRIYIGICWFCTGQVRVVQKPNLSASCPELSAVVQLSDKFLANRQVSLLVAAHHANACHTNIISLIGRHIAKLFVAISPNCLPHRTPCPHPSDRWILGDWATY